VLIHGLGPVADLDGPRAVLITGGRIVAIDAEAEALANADPGTNQLDARGLAAVPGFIELQINGIGGRDFTDDPAAMWDVGAMLAAHGVTSFLPTIVSSARGSVDAALAAWVAGADQPHDGAVALGLHIEGPYLAPARRGAHDLGHLRTPDPQEVGAWVRSGALRILTMAPELPHAMEVIGFAHAKGVVVSVGHTDADAVTTFAAIDAGARYATHLFNAMPPMNHRAPGAAGALLADDRVTLGVIADGHHLDPLMLGLIGRLAPGRISLVSDAVAVLDTRDGAHRLGDQVLHVSDGAVRLADGTLAGSAAGLDACVRGFATVTGSARAAVKAVTATPARLLRIGHERGTLRPGAIADLVLLTPALEVAATIIGGKMAYQSEALTGH